MANVAGRKQLSIHLRPEAYEDAKRAALECGMFLWRWVEIAIEEKIGKVPLPNRLSKFIEPPKEIGSR